MFSELDRRRWKDRNSSNRNGRPLGEVIATQGFSVKSGLQVVARGNSLIRVSYIVVRQIGLIMRDVWYDSCCCYRKPLELRRFAIPIIIDSTGESISFLFDSHVLSGSLFTSFRSLHKNKTVSCLSPLSALCVIQQKYFAQNCYEHQYQY